MKKVSYNTNNACLYKNVGARYDFENSYIIGEYIKINTDSFLNDISSWYVGAGYTFSTWTPFVLYSNQESSSNFKALSTQGMPANVAGAIMLANQTFSQLSTLDEVDMQTLSLGLRYDMNDNAALKFQYDAHERFNQKLDVFSVEINFVF